MTDCRIYYSPVLNVSHCYNVACFNFPQANNGRDNETDFWASEIEGSSIYRHFSSFVETSTKLGIAGNIQEARGKLKETNITMDRLV